MMSEVCQIAIRGSQIMAERERLTQEEILQWLTQRELTSLLARSEACLMENKGPRVFVRGLIETSNKCGRNCIYCGLRSANRDLERYSLSQEQILESAVLAVGEGADSIVLQGGEGCHEPAWLAEVVKEVKKATGVPITLSMGEASRATYELWRKAGADRYLLKHETCSPVLYARLHPGYTLRDRLRCLRELKQLGYKTGSGFIVGLPGQSPEIIAGDIMLCRRLGVEMVGAGPFLPNQNTPLAQVPRGSWEASLRVIAALRLALPWANLPATTALASIEGRDGQMAGLKAGANVLMPSYTPESEAKNFHIYDHKQRVAMRQAREAIAGAGRVFVGPEARPE